MIVGPGFIWLHFPKCAGVAVQAAIRRIYADEGGLTYDEIDPRREIWHDDVNQRKRRDPGFQADGKRVLCCIRRLPHWVLSRVHFEAERPPHYVVTREMLEQGEFFENSGERNAADTYLKKYSTPHVDAWIRVESLASDLARALELDQDLVERALRAENEAKTPYLNNLEFWFTPEQLDQLYARNPLWASLEMRIYGNLPRL